MGLKVAWVGDDLAPVGKLHTSNDLSHLVVAVKATPGLLRAFDQLEDHGERGPVREASLRADRPVSDGREGAFDRIRRTQVLPMFGREVVEGEQRVPVLLEAFGGLLVFDGIGLVEASNAASASFLVSAIQMSCSMRLALGCWLLAAC